MSVPTVTLRTWALCLALAAPLGASMQLSDGRAFSDIDFSTTLPQLSPDGQYAVYRHDAVTDGAFDLWGVALAGGSPVRLSGVLNPGQSVVFAISPDSAYVVYVVDQDVLGTPELYSVPIAGPAGARTKLNLDLVSGGHVGDFLISPTSERVYYRADGRVNNVVELWKVNIDGGASTRLNANITGNYDIFAYGAGRTAGGSERVVYRVGRATVGGHELWSVPATGSSSSARRISRSMVTGGAVANDFQTTFDGTRVVYLADAIDDGSYNLYSVPIGGGTSLELTSGSSVMTGWTLRDSYVTYRQSAAPTAYYRVPIIGGVAVPVPAPVAAPVTSPDGAWTIYSTSVGGVDELWSTPTGGEARKINCPLAPGGDVTLTGLGAPAYSITPDSRSVLYAADQTIDNRIDLYLSEIVGAACPPRQRIFSDGFESGDMGAWQ